MFQSLSRDSVCLDLKKRRKNDKRRNRWFQSLSRDSVCLDQAPSPILRTNAVSFNPSVGIRCVWTQGPYLCCRRHLAVSIPQSGFGVFGHAAELIRPSVGIRCVWTWRCSSAAARNRSGFNPSVGIRCVWTIVAPYGTVDTIVVSIPQSGFGVFGPTSPRSGQMGPLMFQSLSRDSVCLD